MHISGVSAIDGVRRQGRQRDDAKDGRGAHFKKHTEVGHPCDRRATWWLRPRWTTVSIDCWQFVFCHLTTKTPTSVTGTTRRLSTGRYAVRIHLHAAHSILTPHCHGRAMSPQSQPPWRCNTLKPSSRRWTPSTDPTRRRRTQASASGLPEGVADTGLCVIQVGDQHHLYINICMCHFKVVLITLKRLRRCLNSCYKSTPRTELTLSVLIADGADGDLDRDFVGEPQHDRRCMSGVLDGFQHTCCGRGHTSGTTQTPNSPCKIQPGSG